jgi:hypothetical protein
MVLLSPLTTQEAVLSSKIEGTQATMGEVLEFEAGVKPDEKPRVQRSLISRRLSITGRPLSMLQTN